MSLKTAVVMGLVAATMVAGTFPSAYASETRRSRVVLRDGAGDVWVTDANSDVETMTSFPAADVTRALVRHARYAVRVRMRFGDLRRVGYQEFFVGIETPGLSYSAFAYSEARPAKRLGRSL